MHGVICGADEQMEHLLPWWWSRYSFFNAFPVTFFDFGMSSKSRRWCEQRGEVRSISKTPVAEDLHPKIRKIWEKNYGKAIWKVRSSWFCKPKACLLSPYSRSLWLDLDCEVVSSLKPLFDRQEKEMALVREWETRHLPLHDNAVMYNSGVILFSKGDPFIALWEKSVHTKNSLFSGDQQLLSHLISLHRHPVVELCPLWNYRLSEGCLFHAKIYHWTGSHGKKYIEKHGGIFPALCGLK